MEAFIQTRLDKLEESHQIKVIYACESGSRAWGFASRDSDYDVRFLYLHPPAWYLSVSEQRDVIDVLDGDFDAGGWELRKALRLMRGGNAVIHEWLGSPVVYREHAFTDSIREVAAKAFNPVGAFHHYTAMARKKLEQLRSGESKTYKACFYALRAALCARFVADDKKAPPVLFGDLVNQYLAEHQQRIEGAIADKHQQSEADNAAGLQEWINLINQQLMSAGSGDNLTGNKVASDRLDQLMLDACSIFYRF